MTTLANRPNTALLVIDVQNGTGVHTNLSWENHAAPGRTAGIVEAKDVDFATS